MTNAMIANGTASVKTTNVVTVSGAGGSFTINVDGATGCATNFQFRNDTLTKTTTKASMAFLAPAATPVPTGKTMPPLSVMFMLDHQAAALFGSAHAGALLSQWTSRPAARFVHDVAMTPHQNFATATFHTNRLGH